MREAVSVVVIKVALQDPLDSRFLPKIHQLHTMSAEPGSLGEVPPPPAWPRLPTQQCRPRPRRYDGNNLSEGEERCLVRAPEPRSDLCPGNSRKLCWTRGAGPAFRCFRCPNCIGLLCFIAVSVSASCPPPV